MLRMRRLISLLTLFVPGAVCGQVADQDITRPNVYAEVSEHLIQKIVARDLDQFIPINQQDGATVTSGVARTVAKTSVDLVPNTLQATARVTLEGVVYTDVNISRRPVHLHISTVLPFHGRRLIQIDANGAQGNCAWMCGRFADVHLHDVTTNFRCVLDRFVRRVAKVAYHRKKDREFRKALPEALRQILSGFDQGTEPALRKLNQDYVEMTKSAKKAHVDTKQILFATSDDALFAKLIIATPNQPSVMANPPKLAGKRDLAVKIHQHVINQVATPNLASREFTDKNVVTELKGLLGPLAKELKSEPNAKPWRLRFAKKDPLTVAFDEQQMVFVLRTAEIGSEDKSYNKAMDLHVRYRIDQSKSTPSLLRIGRVDPKPPWFKLKPGQRYPFRIQTARSWIRRSFEKAFQERIELAPIRPKGDLARIGELAASDVVADNGWLGISWERREVANSKQP